MTSDCYSLERYDLTSLYDQASLEGQVSLEGQALRLCKIGPETGPRLASALGQILPWSEIALGEQSLLDHFTRVDPALQRFAVTLDGGCVGAVSVRHPWLKGPYLELLGLLPAVQGRGIGRTLMRWFEREAPVRTRNCWLLCSDFNEAALGFYQALGYEKVTLIESLYAAGFHDYLMRKRLSSD